MIRYKIKKREGLELTICKLNDITPDLDKTFVIYLEKETWEPYSASQKPSSEILCDIDTMAPYLFAKKPTCQYADKTPDI